MKKRFLTITISSTKKGVSYFGNSYIKLACDGNGVPGYFKCDDCVQIISVSVKKPHTPDESTIEITDDGHKHYTCSVCGQSVDETDG